MPSRNITELVLPWENLFAVPGVQPCWFKEALVEVDPGDMAEVAFQTPGSIDAVLNDIEVDPFDALSAQFGVIDLYVRGQAHRPSRALAFAADAGGVLPWKYPTKVEVNRGSRFALRVTNTSPVLVVQFAVRMNVFLVRVPD